MRKILVEQQNTIQLLSSHLAPKTPDSAVGVETTPPVLDAQPVTEDDAVASTAQSTQVDDRLKRVEEQVLKIGPFKLSGDFRIRADGVFRSATKPPDPPVPHLQNVRATYRLRLNFDTDIYPSLSFHGQLATGSVNNQLTTNQEFSAIGVRHPFFLNEAWIDYHPNRSLQIQAGRLQNVFADNSRFLFDDDIRFSG
ncbi:MAG TPA: putative porin, partial [Pyrinomonadaceae bacterium]|nr:putative porin [Pyrinomonadaceae bacterium]